MLHPGCLLAGGPRCDDTMGVLHSQSDDVVGAARHVLQAGLLQCFLTPSSASLLRGSLCFHSCSRTCGSPVSPGGASL
jgi:hypothetical protein